MQWGSGFNWACGSGSSTQWHSPSGSPPACSAPPEVQTCMKKIPWIILVRVSDLDSFGPADPDPELFVVLHLAYCPIFRSHLKYRQDHASHIIIGRVSDPSGVWIHLGLWIRIQCSMSFSIWLTACLFNATCSTDKIQDHASRITTGRVSDSDGIRIHLGLWIQIQCSMSFSI